MTEERRLNQEKDSSYFTWFFASRLDESGHRVDDRLVISTPNWEWDEFSDEELLVLREKIDEHFAAKHYRETICAPISPAEREALRAHRAKKEES